MGPPEPGGGGARSFERRRTRYHLDGRKIIAKGRLLKLDFQFNEEKKRKEKRERFYQQRFYKAVSFLQSLYLYLSI
jgi:hypothetical protein